MTKPQIAPMFLNRGWAEGLPSRSVVTDAGSSVSGGPFATGGSVSPLFSNRAEGGRISLLEGWQSG